MNVRDTNSASSIGGIGSFIGNMVSRALEATIGKIFKKIFGETSKAESGITPVKNRDVVHVSNEQPVTLTPEKAGLRGSITRNVSSSSLRPNNPTPNNSHTSSSAVTPRSNEQATKSVPEQIVQLSLDLERVLSSFKALGEKSNLPPDVRRESLENQRQSLRDMQGRLRELRSDAQQQRISFSDSEKIGAALSKGIQDIGKEIRRNLPDTENSDSNRHVESAPTPQVTPSNTQAAPPTGPPSPLAKYTKPNNTPAQNLRELAKAYKNNKENLSNEDLHAFAQRFIQADKDVQNAQGLRPMQVWQQIGETPNEISHLVIDCLSELENRGAAPAA